MTRPRKQLVCVSDTPYYHVVSRCVRRTFLCGVDSHTGKSYEHRRQWIEERIRLLSSLFAIDLCAYAVMSNHYHLVVKLCPEQTEAWTDWEVFERWTSLFKGPPLVQRYCARNKLDHAEVAFVKRMIEVYRNRLADLGWFMKCLNESIAKDANREDDCTGHFWESRFKSQALTTEQTLLSCMAYVDLNPIRAGMAETPEGSDHTSVQERLAPRFDLAAAVRGQKEQHFLNEFRLPLKPLLNFEGAVRGEPQLGILFSLTDYLELVDFTGRSIRPGKRGSIAEHCPPILERLGLTETDWLTEATAFEARFKQNCRAHLAKRRPAA